MSGHAGVVRRSPTLGGHGVIAERNAFQGALSGRAGRRKSDGRIGADGVLMRATAKSEARGP